MIPCFWKVTPNRTILLQSPNKSNQEVFKIITGLQFFAGLFAFCYSIPNIRNLNDFMCNPFRGYSPFMAFSAS